MNKGNVDVLFRYHFICSSTNANLVVFISLKLIEEFLCTKTMAARRPRKELTSKRVRNSLRANILPLVSFGRFSLFTIAIFSPCQLVRPCIEDIDR
jgi:hypothetical protein